HSGYDSLWAYGPTYAQTRESDLGKAAQEDCVFGLHRGKRLAAIAKIAVRIVLDQDGAGSARHFQNSAAGPLRQRPAGWILEVRSNHQELGAIPVEDAFKGSQINAIGGDADSDHLRARFDKKIFNSRINRVFDGNLVTRPDQRALQQVERLLNAAS